MNTFRISPRAAADLQEIWNYIAEDNEAAADRVEVEFHELFRALARTPRIGHTREDLTEDPVLFFALRSYLVVYRPSPKGVEIVALVHGSRDVRRVLGEREN